MINEILAKIQAAETRTLFRPMRCTSEDIENRSAVDGFLYFTTDTKKIYLGQSDGTYLMMGGSSGVFYGNKQLTDEEKYGEETHFYFAFSEIDGTMLPTQDDLILNIPDGGFYRVLSISSVDIYTQRLAISGSGSSGGGSGTSNEGSLSITYIEPPKETSGRATVIAGREYSIRYFVEAKDSAGDLVNNEGRGVWKVNGKEYETAVHNGENSFLVSQYLDSSRETNNITLTVYMNTGGSKDSIVSKSWAIKVINLALEWNYNYNVNSYINNDEVIKTFTLNYIPKGGIDCTTNIIFYDSLGLPVKEYTQKVAAANTGKLVYTDSIDKLPDGSYTVEMYLTATLNEETFKTDSIFHEITFISSNSGTILTVPYYNKSATQYDTVRIPFLVYDKDTENCDVAFYVNDILIAENTYNRNLQYWTYTISDYGTVKLTIKTTNLEDSKDIELLVSKLEFEGVEEVTGAAFNLKANAFSGNNELRNWQDPNTGVTLSFSSNFDWENGGYKSSENESTGAVEQYICVRQGTWMDINYNLFKSTREGMNFKFCFKATNCYNYDAKVLECYEDAQHPGLRILAQDAYFTLNALELRTQYFEDTYIELEAEMWPNNSDDTFLMFWIDGIPAGVKAYSSGEILTQYDSKTIRIGSDECDVYVYVAKAYSRKLTEDEHLNNFIMDAPSSQEMISRYKRNDILVNGQISPEKLSQANPDCHVYMYEIPCMTTSKSDKITGCNYIELYGDNNTLNNPYYQAKNSNTDFSTKKNSDLVKEGALVYVQGTSSAAYGVAGFNLRTKFQEGLINKDQEEVKKWEVSDTAIPINLTCTKVNIASCENANNVVNQEWYNKFQPYHDAHRRKIREDGKLYRDCMEFNSGVVFVLDHNQNKEFLTGNATEGGYLASNVFLDEDGYISNPYYKQYAIGNMGNDKKNSEVFHDEENEKVCCVEITNNQTVEQMMTTKVVNNAALWADGDNMPYEFRYPDGNDEVSEESGMKQAWVDFVNKMAEHDVCAYDSSSHPYGYTGEELGEDVQKTYGPYTFEGFDPPGYEGEANPSGVSIRGFTVQMPYSDTDERDDNGNVTYSHDTKEYRIAKFIHDCEKFLVMDSVIFHYLFVERHTMVDNIAKNTFWSTEDLIHWDLTRNYDNDTADGNNNSGYLTFTYGIEALDKDSKGAEIFNAPDSVWFNFIHNIPTVHTKMYQDLAKNGAWNAEEYLNEFKKHQNIIPERCWIYDYFRKYIRPRRLGLDKDTYLIRLEGGKKTHQRTQYEKYQQFYLDSKYVAGNEHTNQSESVDARFNYESDTWDTSMVMPISYYIDCYSNSEIGGVKIHSQRLKRGEIFNLPVGEKITNPQDATCYLFGATKIQTLQNLAYLYPQYIKLNPAKKLRVVELGSDNEGYFNSRLETISADKNTMLQKVYAQNSGIPDGASALDFSQMFSLKDLRLNNSTFTDLTLADGAVVEILKLNAVKALNISNLTKLTEVSVDDGIYDSIGNLRVNNCPALDQYVYKMALNPNLAQYKITEFTWTAADLTLDDDDNLVSIDVLENLMDTSPVDGSTHAASLKGKIIINSICKADEYTIYEKYCKTYPNLIIEYGDNVNLTEAPEITFKVSNETDAENHYRVLAGGDKTIAQLVSADGPTGTAITTPNRDNTLAEIFTFTGYWIDTEDNKYYLESDWMDKDELPVGQNFAEIIPEGDMTFYPEYVSSVRQYPVRFFDYDGSEIVDGFSNVPYQTIYNGTMTNYYYRDSSDLTDNKRYGFLGWATSPQNGENEASSYFDLDSDLIQSSLYLYAYYRIEDCNLVATNNRYFNFSKNSENTVFTISLKDEYRDILKGKITIPAKTPEGNLITNIREFYNISKITHIYFENGNMINTVDSSAFNITNVSVTPSLVYVGLPNSVIKIGDSAFNAQTKLQTVVLNDNISSIGTLAFNNCQLLELDELPASLTEVKTGTFQSTSVSFSSLKNVTSIGSWAFQNAKKLNINCLPDQVASIGANAFEYAGKEVTSFEIDATSPKEIYSQAFYGYGKNYPIAVNFIGSMSNISVVSGTGTTLCEDPSELGFSSLLTFEEVIEY